VTRPWLTPGGSGLPKAVWGNRACGHIDLGNVAPALDQRTSSEGDGHSSLEDPGIAFVPDRAIFCTIRGAKCTNTEIAASGEDLAVPKPLLLAPCLGTMRFLKPLYAAQLPEAIA
jgi:hypothetical protein